MRTLKGRPLVRSIGITMGLTVGLFGVSPRAEGLDCGAAYYAWSPPTTETTMGAAAAPPNDTAFNRRGNSYSYLAQGSSLFAIRNVADKDGAAGSIKWTWNTPSGMSIPSSPKVVPLSKHGEFIFLIAEDGFLYKINADGTTKGDFSSDTRRTIGDGSTLVCPADQVVATPAVQLYESANVAFQDAAKAAGRKDDDLVFVITRNQCGDHTHNRIIAYWASDLSVKWVFNNNTSNSVVSPHDVDYGTSECALDYGTNTLFCGTNLEDPSATQHSLFALNSINGRLKWSANSGSIHSRPVLFGGIFGGRLYVADLNGRIQAYDPDGSPTEPFAAMPLWVVPLMVPTSIIRNMWPLQGPGPLLLTILLAVGTNGTLYGIADQGTDGIHLFTTLTPTDAVFTTAPVAVQSLGKIYVGRSDGRIQQVDSGRLEGEQTVNSGAVVYDPSLDVEGEASDFNRLVVAADGVGGGPGKVTRLILPLCETPPPG